MSPTTCRRTGALSGALLSLAVLASCSAGSGGSSGGATAETQLGVARAAAPQRQDRTTADTSPTVRTRSVVRTGRIDLTSPDLDAVRRRVEALLASVGGSVEEDTSRNDRHGEVTSSTMVLRVPVARFDTTRRALEDLGRVTASTATQQDVTTEVIDTAERVQTLQNSLDRLQRFQRSARDAKDLIRYEQQITRRQSELRSITAQRDYLADQATLSTLTLHLSIPERRVTPPGALDDAGFLSGLRAGWAALAGSVVVALTALGATVPFLVPLALLGAPVWVLLRRRRTA